jgi:hypothetical protein
MSDYVAMALQAVEDDLRVDGVWGQTVKSFEQLNI